MLRLLRQYVEDRRCKRLHPSLYDDRVQRSKLLKLSEKLRGKTVAIVGNAQSIFELRSGPLIDSAEVVIRINEGFPSKPECQGTRTDVLCLATPTVPETIKSMYGNPAIIFVSPRRAVMSPMLAHDGAVVALPFEIWGSISALVRHSRPSAGLMATWIARQIFAAPTVHLYGFDWKATKTFYADKNRKKHHNWDLERQLMSEWSAEGWLMLPPVPDDSSSRSP